MTHPSAAAIQEQLVLLGINNPKRQRDLTDALLSDSVQLENYPGGTTKFVADTLSVHNIATARHTPEILTALAGIVEQERASLTAKSSPSV